MNIRASKEKRLGPRQYTFLRELIQRGGWVLLSDLRGQLDTPLSRNHKYYMAKDYDERGILERKYRRDDHNRPITMVRITEVGRLWFRYHTLGLLYDEQKMFTPRQQAEYDEVHHRLRSLGFRFMRDSNPQSKPIVRAQMPKRTCEGQQISLF